jgi:SM-20-related protein
LHTPFDTLIDGYMADRVGIADNFLTPALAGHLADNLRRHYAADTMRSAGTGNTGAAADRAFRGDRIHWLDRHHGDPHETAFFNRMDAFVRLLNETCYAGINSYEFHYTLYEPGTFYKKHRDQFRTDDSRQFSMVLYLNEGWVEGDGGALRIYHEDDSSQSIAPIGGRSVFFRSSDLEHEVLPVHEPRMSITGWLKS